MVVAKSHNHRSTPVSIYRSQSHLPDLPTIYYTRPTGSWYCQKYNTDDRVEFNIPLDSCTSHSTRYRSLEERYSKLITEPVQKCGLNRIKLRPNYNAEIYTKQLNKRQESKSKGNKSLV